MKGRTYVLQFINIDEKYQINKFFMAWNSFKSTYKKK